MSKFINLAILAFLILPLLITVTGPAPGAHFTSSTNDDRSDVARIVAEWQEKQSKTKTVRYATKGTEVITKGRYNAKKRPGAIADVPDEDLRIDSRTNWTIDFKKNWIRKEYDTSAFSIKSATLTPFFAIDVFDGTVMKRYTPREKNTNKSSTPSALQPDLQIKSDAYKKFFLLAPDYPVFFAHGFIPTADMSPSPGYVSFPIHAEDFVFHGRGILDGRQCIILKHISPRGVAMDVYWIDPGRNGAILEWARYLGSSVGRKLWAKAEIQYKEGPFGWLPKSWTVTHCDPDTNKVETCENLTVLSADVNLALEKREFQIEASPGEIVEDTPRNKSYKVLQDGSSQALQGDVPVGTGPGWRWVVLVLLAVVLITVLFVRVIVVVLRRKKL